MRSARLSVGLAVAGIAVAVGLFIVLSDDDGSDSGSTTDRREYDHDRRAASGATSTTPELTTIAFSEGAPVGGVQEIEVAKGDHVASTSRRTSRPRCMCTAMSSRRR